MDKLKDVVGLGGKSEEGQEPVSGTKGEGTAPEPFDAGNKQEATDAAAETREFDSEHGYLGSAIDADHDARGVEGSKSKDTNSTADEGKATEEKKSGGGGFMKAIGLGGGGSKKKKEEEEQDARAKAAAEKEEAEKHLPPNHLGSAVPEGTSTDLADPGTVAPGQTDGLAAQKTTTSTSAADSSAMPTSPVTNNGKQPDRSTSVTSGPVGLSSADRSGSASDGRSGSQLLGSRGEHRGSMIPADAPKYKRVENPDRIPTAGGKRIGEEQYQTRRASMAPPASPPRDMARLDREGSPDAVTAGNTEKNVAPAAPAAAPAEAKNTAPKEMREFSMGGASKDAEAKPVGAGATEDVAPDEGGTGMKEKLTPSSPSSAGKENAGGHARRGSVFDKIKEKVKGRSGSGSQPKSP